MSPADGSGGYSDSARRLADTVSLHLTATNGEAAGSWIAARLTDGGTDGILYDTRRDAIAHQLHESLCGYVLIPPSGMGPREAESFLHTCRALRDAGIPLADPDNEVFLRNIAITDSSGLS